MCFSILLFLLFSYVVFDTFELNDIFDMITSDIRLHGDFRFVVLKYYYGKSGRGKISDIFDTMDLNTEHCSSWPQLLTFECREIRKRKTMKNSHRAHSVFVYFSIGILVNMLLKEVF